MKKPLLFTSLVVAVMCIALPSCTYDYLTPINEEDSLVINDTCGWVNITSTINTNYPQFYCQAWILCPDTNYHFTNNAEYQLLLDCKTNGPSHMCDSLPSSIDFNNYDALAISTMGLSSMALYERELYKCDAEYKYKYVVNLYTDTGGGFFPVDYSLNMIVIPKIPIGYTVIFEENDFQ